VHTDSHLVLILDQQSTQSSCEDRERPHFDSLSFLRISIHESQ
jgi:hypothetical protein